MKAVKGHRYLYRRGDKLIYRRSVPMFAQAAFDNRAEVQVSLRTSDVAEARHLLPRENAKFEKTIADLKGHVSPAASAARRTGTVGTQKIEKVIRAYFADRMERVQEIDPSDAAAASDLIVLKADIERFREDVTESRKPGFGGWNQITLWTGEAIQDREGWALEGNDQKALMRLVAQAQVEAAELIAIGNACERSGIGSDTPINLNVGLDETGELLVFEFDNPVADGAKTFEKCSAVDAIRSEISTGSVSDLARRDKSSGLRKLGALTMKYDNAELAFGFRDQRSFNLRLALPFQLTTSGSKKASA